MDVYSRLSIWFVFNVIAGLVLLYVFARPNGLGLMMSGRMSSADIRTELVTITVLYMCSVLALVWPGAHWGLTAFGVVWALVGGRFVYALWQV